MARVEGNDRKSFFAVAESENGVDDFRFWDHPVVMPETDDPDTNVYDMRLTAHEDGWIYGIFCTERKDPQARPGRHVVGGGAGGHRAHEGPREVGAPARPQVAVGAAAQRRAAPRAREGPVRALHAAAGQLHRGGQGRRHRLRPVRDAWSARRSARRRSSTRRSTTRSRRSRTAPGATPLKTAKGWLHIAHGVRNTAAGLRYVLYAFLCDLDDPSKVIARPGRLLPGPRGRRAGRATSRTWPSATAP